MDVHGYIDDIKKRIKGKHVLDIGCLGSYKKTLLLRHNQWRETASKVIGIDNNLLFLREMMAAHPDLDLHYCDITDKGGVKALVEEIGQFNHIIATDIIEHVGNLTAFLEGVKIFMTEEATIYLTTSNVRSFAWHAMWDGSKAFLFNDDHICWFDIDTLKSLLGRSGLRIMAVYYCFNKVDRQLANQYKVEWRPDFGRRIYLQIRKALS